MTNPEYAGLPPYQWLSVHIVALVVIAASVTGSLIIVVMTVREWRDKRTTLTTMQLFPLWIACTDCLYLPVPFGARLKARGVGLRCVMERTTSCRWCSDA